MSVAKIWMGTCAAFSPSASSKLMATEYTSSPVEQPGTQIRSGRLRMMCG